MKCYFTDAWDSLLAVFAPEHKDIYFEEKYVRLYETEREKAAAYVAEENDKILLMPVLLREFDNNGTTLYDFETPYGYGGPLCNTPDMNFILRALNGLKKYGIAHHFVAGFVRFHPLLGNETGFDSIGTVIPDRQTVAIDTALAEEEMWLNEIHSKNRNTIRKGAKSGLTFVADHEYSNMDKFVALYEQTMHKLHADAFYYFSSSYYERFRQRVDNGFLGTVWLNGRMIAAALFMYCGRFGHYHLAGSDEAFLAYGPNNFLLWNVACEMHRLGVECFHLGGGINADPHNSLLEFKKRFSKKRYCFSIGKIVFDEQIYRTLCAEWECMNAGTGKEKVYEKHLLKYKY